MLTLNFYYVYWIEVSYLESHRVYMCMLARDMNRLIRVILLNFAKCSTNEQHFSFPHMPYYTL